MVKRCGMCGGRVRIYSGGEGTNSYESVEEVELREAVRLLSKARDGFALDVGTGERAIEHIRSKGYVFKRFPRTEPPTNDEERWECLAFWLYTYIAETRSRAEHSLAELDAWLKEKAPDESRA